MAVYKAPLKDINFVLNEVLDVSTLAKLPGYQDATPDTIQAILEEAAKLCENVLFPLNRTGDEEGCTYENGVVRTPKGFKEAYRQYAEGGWMGISAPTELGGQGLQPRLLAHGTHAAVLAEHQQTDIGMPPVRGQQGQGPEYQVDALQTLQAAHEDEEAPVRMADLAARQRPQLGLEGEQVDAWRDGRQSVGPHPVDPPQLIALGGRADHQEVGAAGDVALSGEAELRLRRVARGQLPVLDHRQRVRRVHPGQ